MSRFVSEAGEQVAHLATRAAESGRMSRGRALFRKGSVSDLAVVEGSLIATVRGSEGDDYETTIGTAPAPPGVVREVAQAQNPEQPRSIDDLIDDGVDICPRDMDLAFGCDCADWDEPCKHVVAVLLAFADRVDLDATELLRWRGIDPVQAKNDEPGVPSPARPPVRSAPRSTQAEEPKSAAQSGWRSKSAGQLPVDEPEDRTATLSELEALLGDTVMRVPQTTDSNADEPPHSALEPAMADFLGVTQTVGPVDVSKIATPATLFATVQLGPLADLGPELAEALAIISARLHAASPE